jgi:5,10-methylenetetrahydromethanopterin reductase
VNEAARPSGERHLAIHEGHATHVNARDDMLLEVAPEIPMRGALWIGTRDELRARAEYAASNGVTELLYAPVGPNAADELRRMAVLLAD